MNPRLRRAGRNHNHNNNGRRNNNFINRNTVLDSLGPAGKLRGTAYQLMEKYMAAAKDFMASDRVTAENCLQHAEHYMRLNAFALAQENQNRFNGNNNFQKPQEGAAEPENEDAVAENETENPAVEDAENETEKTLTVSKPDLSVPVALMAQKAVQDRTQQTEKDTAPEHKRRGRPPKKKEDAQAS